MVSSFCRWGGAHKEGRPPTMVLLFYRQYFDALDDSDVCVTILTTNFRNISFYNHTLTIFLYSSYGCHTIVMRS